MITKTETITQMIRRLSATNVGPDELTKAVLTEVSHSPEQMYQALEEMLPSYCRRALGLQRRIDIKLPIDPPPPAEKPTGKRSPISKKQERIRQWYSAQLAEQFSIGGSYKRLGECTAIDLITSAAERRSQAAGALSWATKLEALADALGRYQATTVVELPEAVFTEIWKPRS